MQHPIIQTISQLVPVNAGEAAFILSYFQEKKYRRGDALLKEGETAQHIFFVEKGALHQYYTDDNGNEHTCNFIFENEFITDLESFSKKLPSTCFIKALEPTICHSLRCADLMELMASSEATKEFFRIVVENVAAEGIRRTRALQSASPERSFCELLEKRPDIFQRVPQRYIAQYLGIAPESLSRIKKRLLTQAKS